MHASIFIFIILLLCQPGNALLPNSLNAVVEQPLLGLDQRNAFIGPVSKYKPCLYQRKLAPFLKLTKGNHEDYSMISQNKNEKNEKFNIGNNTTFWRVVVLGLCILWSTNFAVIKYLFDIVPDMDPSLYAAVTKRNAKLCITLLLRVLTYVILFKRTTSIQSHSRQIFYDVI